MASISAHTMKTSADRSTRSLSIGTLNIHIVAHRFFHIVDARHWHQVETFHHYRDISLSAQRHADIYKADLERISDHDSVPGPLRKTASNLLKHFKNDEFVDKFSKITDMVGERRANRGVRSLLFGVAENVGAPPAPSTAGCLGSKRSWKEEHTARSNALQEHASIISTNAFTLQSVEDQIGEDDSTLDGHQDFEFAAVNNDGETDRDQEAEESDDVDDDELGEIILPHDFHGLFEALYRAANKQTFRIPKMPKMESTLKTTLFQYVKDLLTVYHDLPRVRQKDLYVAASSVVYLHCSGSETIFKAHDMPNLLEMTKETEMAIPSTALSDLLMTLKEQARDDQGIFDVRQLVDLIDIEKGSLATKRHQGQKIDVTVKLAIDVLQSVAPLCVADPIRRPVDTEQKSQGVWERVFNIIFAKTAVTAVIGETGLEGSGEARSQNEADHAVERLKGDKEKEMDRKKEFPRKVDCKFVVSVERMKRWEFITISNSEMKALRSTADEVEVMVRKNIRHNHLIINQIGTPKMYFLNMHAYSASLMSLHEHDGVHVCGKVLDHDLLIPTNALELECFMDGRTLAALFSLRSFFLQIGRELAFQRLNSGSGGSTPMSAFSNVWTFYTPKKSRSMPSPKKQPLPIPRKHPMDHSSSSSSSQMDPQMMMGARKRRG